MFMKKAFVSKEINFLLDVFLLPFRQFIKLTHHHAKHPLEILICQVFLLKKVKKSNNYIAAFYFVKRLSSFNESFYTCNCILRKRNFGDDG